jgi:PAS domain S-box-containing protein
MTYLRSVFGELSLRSYAMPGKFPVIVVLVGVTLAASVAAWSFLQERRSVVLEKVAQDQARIVDVLVEGMAGPLWDVDRAAGMALVSAVMLDQRVVSVSVSSPSAPRFLAVEEPARRHGPILSQTRSVVHADRTLGFVQVTMDADTGLSALPPHWLAVLLAFLLPFTVGSVVVYALWRYPAARMSWRRSHQRWLRLLQDAIESAPNGFSVYDASQRLVVCNSAFASLYDGDPDALVGCTAVELYRRILPLIQTVDGRPPEPPARAPHIAHAHWSENREPAEIQLKDGRWLLVSRHPTTEGGNVFVRTNITRLKQMEQALRDSEQRFRCIAETHPVPVVICALQDDRLLYVSPGTASLLAASVEAILASSPQTFFAEVKDLQCIKNTLLGGESVGSYECTLKKIDGSLFPAAVTARRVSYLGTDAAVGGIIDLTAIRRAEREIARQREALHQSEKLNALGSLLAGVAHELNNPLSVVVGRSLMLESEGLDGGATAQISKVRLAAERCARIVKTFLAIARQQPPERASVQLNGVITRACELMGYSLRTADIEMRLDLDPRLPALAADADQLTQVFTNLIINAQQALLTVERARRLHISTSFDAGEGVARVEIRDNGPGVPQAIRSRIFEPFYTSKPIGAGTGIGLSFSYGVIESHGGRLTLEDSHGDGARFVIVLPVAGVDGPGRSVDAVDGTPAVSGSASGESPEVLVVDDEREIAEP